MDRRWSSKKRVYRLYCQEGLQMRIKPNAAIASRCCAAGLRHSAGSEQHWNGRMGVSPGRQTRLDPVGHASMKPTISFHKLRNFGFWHRRKCDQQIHNYTGISKTR